MMWRTTPIVHVCLHTALILHALVEGHGARDEIIVDKRDNNNDLRENEGQDEQRNHRCAFQPLVMGSDDDGDNDLRLNARIVDRLRPAAYYYNNNNKRPVVYREINPKTVYLRRLGSRPVMTMVMNKPSKDRSNTAVRYYYDELQLVPPVKMERVRYVLMDDSHRNAANEDIDDGDTLTKTDRGVLRALVQEFSDDSTKIQSRN